MQVEEDSKINMKDLVKELNFCLKELNIDDQTFEQADLLIKI